MKTIVTGLALIGLLAGCATKREWQWVGGGPEPGEAKLLEQYSVCSGVEPDTEINITICMSENGWVPRREGNTSD